ncbi:MAG TPA: hypothetical protein VEB21_12395 [Terriglobales bacterium]|nr:hypothetical protein [Terriglobales bacterium]
MQDITAATNEYRECVRHLWNTYILPRVTPGSGCDANDDFDDIARLLFSAIVFTGATDRVRMFGSEPLCDVVVVPAIESAPIPILIQRLSCDGNRYWDHPSKEMTIASGMVLHFINFFDWSSYGPRDLQYCHTRIVACELDRDLVGRDALVETRHVRILLSDNAGGR